jgi:tetratricopeptide (TPR) repeat protein
MSVRRNAHRAARRRSRFGFGAHDGACVICLEEDPPPIQSGCSCRGEQGLAHPSCRARQARSSGNADDWWRCSTCKRRFTGAMLHALSRALLARGDIERGARGARGSLLAESVHAMSLAGSGRYAEAEATWRALLAVVRREMGEEHEQTLEVKGYLAALLARQGKGGEAEELALAVVDAARRTLGAESGVTLKAAAALASALGAQGKHADAERVFRDTLRAWGRTVGPEHEETMVTTTNLASELERQGKHAEAERLYRDVLRVSRRTNGPAHPLTLSIMRRLALARAEQGALDEAVLIGREALETSTASRGAEHRNTRKLALVLARLLSAKGDHAEAAALLRAALATGATVQVVGDVQMELGRALATSDPDEADEAEALLREVVAARTRELGADAPATLQATHGLVEALTSLTSRRKCADAARCSETLVPKLARAFGAEHPTTLAAKNNYATCLNVLGRHAESVALNRDLLAARSRTRPGPEGRADAASGEESESVLITKGNLASGLGAMRQFEEAERLRREVLAAYERRLGAEHPKTLQSKERLASAMLQAGKVADAARMHREVYGARERLLGPESAETKRSAERLALALSRLTIAHGAHGAQGAHAAQGAQAARCSNPECTSTGAAERACPKCKLARYCSRECLRAHHKAHKRSCE